jgi:ABC-type enterochelin transport system permease subunit
VEVVVRNIMNANAGGARLVALLVGAFLVVEGVWGLFSPEVFGVLTINHTRAIIHLLLGLGAWWASSRGVVSYLTFLGLVISAVALLWAMPATRGLVFEILAVNRPGAVLDGVVGPVCLLTALLSGRQMPGLV